MRKDEIMIINSNINNKKKLHNWKSKISFLSGLKKLLKFIKNTSN